jgi:hypothetical protein
MNGGNAHGVAMQLSLPLVHLDRNMSPNNDVHLSHGLIIREPWLSLILSGRKTWEIRGANTSRRGRISLIRSGSLTVVGYCDLTGTVGPLTLSELLETREMHCIEASSLVQTGLPYRTTAHCTRIQLPRLRAVGGPTYERSELFSRAESESSLMYGILSATTMEAAHRLSDHAS